MHCILFPGEQQRVRKEKKNKGRIVRARHKAEGERGGEGPGEVVLDVRSRGGG